jgi:hypothetical protein
VSAWPTCHILDEQGDRLCTVVLRYERDMRRLMEFIIDAANEEGNGAIARALSAEVGDEVMTPLTVPSLMVRQTGREVWVSFRHLLTEKAA